MHVPYVRILQEAKEIRFYSVSFVRVWGLGVVGGCFVATLDVQQMPLWPVGYLFVWPVDFTLRWFWCES